MEFNEKLQQLRKQKRLTQEELAERLYVSRTAVSKWESGRGFPSIESLKAIAQVFAISVDELLSGEEILTLAENDHKQKVGAIKDLVFGLLDCGMALLLLFVPVFANRTPNHIWCVPLIALTNARTYLKAAYLSWAVLMVAMGILTLALQNCQKPIWLRCKYGVTCALSVMGVCLFVISQQPYAAIVTFAFLVIKTFLLIKQR